MADTIPNITIPIKQWVDLYALSGVAVGTIVSVENISVCDVFLTIQATQPPVTHDSFTIIQRNNGLVFSTGSGAAGLWAFCNNDGAKVNVRVKSSVTDEQLTAYGERLVAELTPVIQITAYYGLLEQAEEFSESTATTGAVDSLFFVTTGLGPFASGTVATRRHISYRAGQGLLARLTAIFDTPMSNSFQLAGFIGNTDLLGFGFNNEEFGAHYIHGGESEIQELTITTSASGSENATITVDDIPVIVPLTAGTVQHNAFEIANSLVVQFPRFNFSSNNDQVVAISLSPVPGGTFAFSSATAIAAWEQIQAAVLPFNDFIPQTSWNIDKRPDLDPFKGNEYQIRFHYQGFGGIEFFVEDIEITRPVLVHRIQLANTSTAVSVNNPIFRVGWLASNINQSDPLLFAIDNIDSVKPVKKQQSLTVRGGSAGAFIEGKIVPTELPRTVQNTNTLITSANFRNIIAFRSRFVFGNKTNRVESTGLILSLATDSVKAGIVEVRINPIFAGELIFQYIDKTNSITEVALEPLIVTGGRLIASIFIPSRGGTTLRFEGGSGVLLSGQILSVTGSVTAGATTSISASFTFQEDL